MGHELQPIVANNNADRGEPEVHVDDAHVQEIAVDIVADDRRKLRHAMGGVVGVIVLLLVTRLDFLHIKSLLLAEDPALELPLGTIGVLRVSASLVFQLDKIMQQADVRWSHALLYVPSLLLPFGPVVGLLFRLQRVSPKRALGIVGASMSSLRNVAISLIAALVFVYLSLRVGGEQASIVVLARALGPLAALPPFAFLIGAFGAFFSGSATVSNLTFGAIQLSAAAEHGRDLSSMLALQAAGAAFGNQIAIANIVAVTGVLHLRNAEKAVLFLTIKTFAAGAVAACLLSWLV